MDESFMSTSSFDDENFLSSALGNENNNADNNFSNSSISTQHQPQQQNSNKNVKAVDISGLLNQPFESDQLPKSKLNFADLDTPRNCSLVRRKRKNFARRCLSTDLNNDSFNNTDDDCLSFQHFRQSKEIKREGLLTIKTNVLSSIENTISPEIRNSNKSVIKCLELTPEFDNTKQTKQKSYEYPPRVPLKTTNNVNNAGVPLQKCFSENHASIMRALQVSSSDPMLIGDFSKPYILPLLKHSKHQDLKSISCHVLADLLQGRYNNMVESFTIVDCRYPYEFEGGHIQNAINIYTQEHILSKLLYNCSKTTKDITPAAISSNSTTTNNNKRRILIFHCEFSSERGPSLCRFLRNKDRVTNTQVYPYLHYPELYLLEGGYKEFFANYSSLCQPSAYRSMYDKDHEEDLRKFRSLVKSHSFDSKFSTHKRNLRL